MDDGQTAALIYMTVLGVALLSGLFALYRNRLSTAMQHGAIWLLIFLAATLLAAWSDELGDALFPTRVATITEDVIEIRRHPSGHFIAEGAVNGVPVEFIVDTGATHIVLSRADAQRAGIDTEGLVFSGRALTANGPVGTAMVDLERLAFGGIEDRGVRATVNEGALDISLLGMAWLDRFDRITVERDVLRLER
ncbi:MAG: retropepsin-like aspartic protease family protein [Rubricella sp.]